MTSRCMAWHLRLAPTMMWPVGTSITFCTLCSSHPSSHGSPHTPCSSSPPCILSAHILPLPIPPFDSIRPYTFGLLLHILGSCHLEPEESSVLPSHPGHVPITALLHCFLLDFNSPSFPVSFLRARALSCSSPLCCVSHRT